MQLKIFIHYCTNGSSFFLMEEPLNRGGGGIALLIMEKIPFLKLRPGGP